ncbi:MAG: hypothetical protein R3C10_18480 [Pirellulales bacterium]
MNIGGPNQRSVCAEECWRRLENDGIDQTVIAQLRQLVYHGPPEIKVNDQGVVVWARFFALALQRQHLDILANFHELRWLCLSHTDITDADLTHLSSLKHLEWLSLHCTDIQGENLDELLSLRDLRYLSLFGAPIKENAMRALGEFPTLRRLVLSRTPIVDDWIVHLASLTSLEVLYLRYTKLSERRITELQDAIPKCRIKRLANGAPYARGL